MSGARQTCPDIISQTQGIEIRNQCVPYTVVVEIDLPAGGYLVPQISAEWLQAEYNKCLLQ